MKRENALRHLLLIRVSPENASNKYGSTNLARSIAAWNVALLLAGGNESKVTQKLLNEVIELVESGDDSIKHLLNGEDEDLLKLLKSKK
jgi:hypothetical protein